MSINLMLDSTVYKQSPQLKSEYFQFLRKQCRIKIIKLYIPEIVEREYLTWIDEHVEDTFTSIQKKLQSLNRLLPEKNVPELNFISFVSNMQLEECKKLAVVNWQKFKEDVGAVYLPIESHHGSYVMNAYFKGDKPFSSPKKRDDIPDAFISACLMDLCAKEQKVYFVSNDKKFLESYKDLPQASIVSNLVDFFSMKEVATQTGIEATEQVTKSIENVLLFFRDELRPKFEAPIRAEIETMELIDYFREYFMQDLDPYPYISIIELDLKKELAKSLVDNIFVLPFTATIQVELTYGIEAVNLCILGKNRIEKLIYRDEMDLGYYKLTEGFPVKINGNFSVSLSEIDPMKWANSSNEIIIKLESIEIEWS